MRDFIYNTSMKAEIISIGTEILLGHIVNTNTSYLSKKLASIGIDVYYHTTVGDNPGRLVSAVRKALSRSDIVFTTGGLGPTVDDITLSGISKALSRKLIYDKKIEKYIKTYFTKRKLSNIPEETLRQAYIPKGSVWFENKVGTAPSIAVKLGKKVLIALPGPPRELIPLVEKNIIPFLKKNKFSGKHIIKTRTLKVTGIIEVEVNKIVKDLLSIGPKTTLGIYVHLGEVDLKITSKANNLSTANHEISKLEKELRKRLGNYIFGSDGDTLESVVGKLLLKNKKTLSIAESCTGGLIQNRITNVNGSSKYFSGGVVSYSNELKTSLLKVSKKEIKKYGAISKEVALSMAEGIRKITASRIALGVTGIAGPLGATKKKPVGLVYISLVDKKFKIVKEYRFVGSREDIKLLSSNAALDLLRAFLS